LFVGVFPVCIPIFVGSALPIKLQLQNNPQVIVAGGELVDLEWPDLENFLTFGPKA